MEPSQSEGDRTRVKYSKLVSDTAVKAATVIMEGIKDTPSKEHWLLVGRIINQIFALHYQLSIKASEEMLRNMEARGSENDSSIRNEPAGSGEASAYIRDGGDIP